MSRIDKLIDRFKSLPVDFSWNDLLKLMKHFDFEESQKGKTSGSRVSFWRKDFPLVNLHKPHGNNSIGLNTMRDIKAYLEDQGFL